MWGELEYVLSLPLHILYVHTTTTPVPCVRRRPAAESAHAARQIEEEGEPTLPREGEGRAAAFLTVPACMLHLSLLPVLDYYDRGEAAVAEYFFLSGGYTCHIGRGQRAHAAEA